MHNSLTIWRPLRQYAFAVGVDSLCANSDVVYVTRYLT